MHPRKNLCMYILCTIFDSVLPSALEETIIKQKKALIFSRKQESGCIETSKKCWRRNAFTLAAILQKTKKQI